MQMANVMKTAINLSKLSVELCRRARNLAGKDRTSCRFVFYLSEPMTFISIGRSES